VEASIKMALGAEIFKSAAGAVSVWAVGDRGMVTFGMKQEDAGSTVPCTRRLRPSRMETMNFKNMPSVGFCYNLF
jgi:hypothetical protein